MIKSLTNFGDQAKQRVDKLTDLFADVIVTVESEYGLVNYLELMVAARRAGRNAPYPLDKDALWFEDCT